MAECDCMQSEISKPKVKIIHTVQEASFPTSSMFPLFTELLHLELVKNHVINKLLGFIPSLSMLILLPEQPSFSII